MKVLVIDDEPDLADFVRFYLQTDGHDVTVAKDCEEAIALATKNNFDYVVSDVRMPMMDGPALAKEILRVAQVKPIFIFCTSFAEDFPTETKDLNIGGFLVKPIQRGELLRIIQGKDKKKP